MARLILLIVLISLFNVPVYAQTPGYYEIVGNRDGSPIKTNIGSLLEIPVWGVTPTENDSCGLAFIHIPLASNDSIINFRYPSYHFDPNNIYPYHSYIPDSSILFNWTAGWTITHGDPDLTLPNYTNSSYVAFANNGDIKFLTRGDTLIMGSFMMKTVFDSNFLGQTIDALAGGHQWINGTQLWGLCDGLTEIYPLTTYGQLEFFSDYELGSIAGTISDSLSIPIGSVVIEAQNSFRTDTTNISGEYDLPYLEPGYYDLMINAPGYETVILYNVQVTAQETNIVDFQFGGPCVYLPGDNNNSGNLNGLDMVYLIHWLRGGPPPMECDCPPFGPIYISADVNGSCSFNYQDITYLLNYYRGGNAPIGCADCPPGG